MKEMFYLTTHSTHFIYGYMTFEKNNQRHVFYASLLNLIKLTGKSLLVISSYNCFCIYIKLRLMYAFLGTHLSYLGCLSRTVSLLDVIERQSALDLLLFVVSFMFISTSGSSMLSWANTSAICAVCLDLHVSR